MSMSDIALRRQGIGEGHNRAGWTTRNRRPAAGLTIAVNVRVRVGQIVAILNARFNLAMQTAAWLSALRQFRVSCRMPRRAADRVV